MSPRRLPLHRKLIYSTIVFAGVFGFLEVGLRLASVGRPPVVGKLRFGYETGVPLYDSDGVEEEGVVYQDVPLFERHAELFWRPIANSPFTGPRGLRKPEPEWKVDTEDVFTVLVLGDSCSFLGQLPYASRLTTLLQADKHKTVRVFNASCPGYSSAQGVLRLKDFESLRPDVVVVYFGWNDHWRSLNGCTDRVLVERNKFAARTQTLLGHFHFYWLIYSLAAPLPKAQPVDPIVDAPVRVPLADYAENLTAIAQRVAAWNGRVLLLTAPSAFQEQHMPDWAGNFFGEFYQMSSQQVADIPKTHRQYNERVLSLAADLANTTAVDLDASFARDASLFRSDCIHLSEQGHALAAKLLAEATIAKAP